MKDDQTCRICGKNDGHKENECPRLEDDMSMNSMIEKVADFTVMVDVEIVEGVEGTCLVINDNRVCGPKPWGGGRVTKKWRASAKIISDALPIHAEYMKWIESKRDEIMKTTNYFFGTPLNSATARLFTNEIISLLKGE